MYMRLAFWLAGSLLVLLACALAFIYFSPWPGALLMRHVMDRGGVGITLSLQKHAPSGVTEQLNEHYEAGNDDAYLDVFYPATAENTDQVFPTIVWIHGGGWLGGSRQQAAGYLKIFASQGFTAVGVGYSLAPGGQYPVPLKQIDVALGYLQRNAARLHVDARRFFLAGDSFGAQMAAQLANIIADPAYAASVGIAPSIERSALRGVMLFCGMYDATTPEFREEAADLWTDIGIQFWAYLGTKAYLDDPRTDQLSVALHLTKDFPPMFITVGNSDWLAPQSYLMAERALALKVPVDSLFPAKSDPVRTRHQFQFDLDSAAGKLALERAVAFLRNQSR